MAGYISTIAHLRLNHRLTAREVFIYDPSNSGKTFTLNKGFNLFGQKVSIASGITLKPAGGYFRNGTLSGTDFTISTEKTNKIFDDDLVLDRL